MKHATVRIGEYVIPLIGVPTDATQQECANCKKSFHLSDVMLDVNGTPFCKKCLAEAEKNPTNSIKLNRLTTRSSWRIFKSQQELKLAYKT